MITKAIFVLLITTTVSVTSLQCFSTGHWFHEGESPVYQPTDELHAIVCQPGVEHCTQTRQVGSKNIRDFGSYEVLGFDCDIYSECINEDGKYFIIKMLFSPLKL